MSLIGGVGAVDEMGIRVIPFGCDGVKDPLMIIEHIFLFVKWVEMGRAVGVLCDARV